MDAVTCNCREERTYGIDATFLHKLQMGSDDTCKDHVPVNLPASHVERRSVKTPPHKSIFAV